MTLPVAAVETDHRLENTAERASGELAKHRWHWTLDESNPERVSIREYARQVGRNQQTIGVHANGYAGSVKDASFTLDEHIGMARMSGETAAAAARRRVARESPPELRATRP